MTGLVFAGITFVGLLALLFVGAREWQRRTKVAERLHAGNDDPALAVAPAPDGPQAGVRSVLIAAIAALAVAALLLAVTGRLSLAVGLASIGGALAFIVDRTRIDRSMLALEEGLADALGLVTSALRVGASPLDAFQRATRETRGPLRSVLTDLTGRLAAGEPPAEVAARMRSAAPVESIRLLALCIAVQWNAGGQLSRSLSVVSRSVRDRADVLRRVETQAAPTRGSVLLLAAANLAIAAIVWTNDPAGITRFLDSGVGAALVTTTLLFQGLSLLWMWRISRIQL